ncbi:hypothetical protein M1N58_03430, partial [Dehalococcoidales bacterium]|nr:hypothetical protein [Dehalococcoidales bacterium]
MKIAVKLPLAIISPGSPSILPRIDRKVCAIYDDSFRGRKEVKDKPPHNPSEFHHLIVSRKLSISRRLFTLKRRGKREFPTLESFPKLFDLPDKAFATIKMTKRASGYSL